MRAVNLLTPELRSAQKGSGAARPSAMETSGGIGAIALLGALALCVAAVAGYVLANNVVKERQATLAAVSTKNDETVKRATDLKPYADFQTLAQERSGTVTALASARFDWEQSLRDLSRALPSNVYLSTLKGSVGAGSSGASGIRSAIPSPAIELAGCTRSQPAVATLMSRLRNIQGVTRVSLSKSEKADTVGTTAGSTTGPCGKGSPPSFELVVFFEKATVSADLATATGDSGTTAADSTATTDGSAKASDGSSTKTGNAATTPTPTPATQGGATP
jgi:Tfp pilus assembly protein PilN